MLETPYRIELPLFVGVMDEVSKIRSKTESLKKLTERNSDNGYSPEDLESKLINLYEESRFKIREAYQNYHLNIPEELSDFDGKFHETFSSGINDISSLNKLVTALAEEGFNVDPKSVEFVGEHFIDADRPNDTVKRMLNNPLDVAVMVLTDNFFMRDLTCQVPELTTPSKPISEPTPIKETPTFVEKYNAALEAKEQKTNPVSI